MKEQRQECQCHTLVGRGGGGDGDAQFLELGTCAALFFGARIALDDFAKFLDTGIFLAEFEESHALLETSGGKLETLGVIVEDLVVFLDGLLITLLGVGNFAEPELSVGGEVGIAVVLQIVAEFGMGKIIFAAGEVAKTVGVECVGRRRRATGAERGSGTRRSGGRSAGRSAGDGSGRAASKTSVNTLNGVLKIDELLIEFANAGFDFLEVVGDALKLSGHGIETCAGIGLNILDGFLEGGHGGVELVHGVAGLLNESFLDSMVLSHLGLDVFLTLEEGSDVALEFDDLASDGECGLGADQTAGESAGEQGGGEDEDVTRTHGKASRKDIRGMKGECVPMFQFTGR